MTRKQQAGPMYIKKRKTEDDYDGPADTVISVAALAKTKKRQTVKSRNKKTKDNVADIVDALLGDSDSEEKRPAASKKKNKKTKAKKLAAKDSELTRQEAKDAREQQEGSDQDSDGKEEEAAAYNDDDVADLYAWSSDDEGDQEGAAAAAAAQSDGRSAAAAMQDQAAAAGELEEAALRAERQRALLLAMSVAEDTEKHKSDLPKDENEWFDRLDEERQRGRKPVGGSKRPAQGYLSDDDGDLPTDLVRAAGADDKRASGRVVRVPKEKREAVGKFLAIDCEMVGAGFKGSRSMLARVSIVNYYGHVVLDTFVQPTEEVTDYRTWVSGIRKEDLEKGQPFKDVQQLVSDLTKDRVLVGHAIKNDLGALMLRHPPSLIRDTAQYHEFKKLNKGAPASLRMLAATLLNLNIQDGEHSSVVDAKTTMLLYRKVKDRWEMDLAPRRYRAKMLREKSKARFEQLRREIDEQRSQLKVQHEQQLRGIYKQ
ncbi:3'-5' exonuclease [Coemansia sp. RSA 2599]|nr:3'-5' exonuclease [Coemansia sp. RSA 2598]KAJ1828319.1 3'-5' exonuclease [Coemansia sp. RSA 2599]